MTEREKVLNDLRELCEYLFHEYKVCYHGDEEDTYNRFLAANNALNLLKEQEAVKPLKSKLSFTHGFDWEIWDCGCCGNQLRSFAKYCDQCGRAVKWDE